MKRVLYLLLLVVLSITVVNANHQYDIEGVFSNYSSSHIIKVRSFRKGIKVKVLDHHHHGWRRYYQVGPRTFESNCGSRIRVKHNRKGLKLKIRYADGSRETYRRHSFYQNECYSNDWGGDWNTYDDFPPQYSFRHSSVEGTYKDREGNRIAILETREGFKAKFVGDRKWKNYRLMGRIYQDKRGNKYEVLGNGVLEWQGAKSRKRIRIQKISDVVEY